MPNKYGKVEYWDEQFEKGEFEKPFDWLASWSELKEDIIEVISDKESRILIPGCGNAPFQIDMFDDGYEQMVCGDNSQVVVRQMEDTYADRGIEWNVMDVTCMPYEDECFDAIIDKSLTCCLLCCDDAFRTMRLYLDEAFRVLVPGGTIVIISFVHEPVIQASLRGRAWQLVKTRRIVKDADEMKDCKPETCLMLYACVKQKTDDAADAVVSRCSSNSSFDQTEKVTYGVEHIIGRKSSAKERKKAEKAQRRMLQASVIDANCEM